MELRGLRYFLAVAREESISGAAEHLHLSQPTLSRQLMDLEQELGKTLFIRGNRRITLTEEDAVLCFRPLSPAVHAHMSVAWKKFQVFSKASEKFLEELRKKEQ